MYLSGITVKNIDEKSGTEQNISSVFTEFGGLTNKTQTNICQLYSLYNTATVKHY